MRTIARNLLPKAFCLVVLSLVISGHSQAQTYRDNETLYSNQDPNTETRRSDRFRICFGHYNRDTGTPVTEQLVQGNLQMFEQMWNRWVTEMGLHDINESVTNPDGNKYRANFNILMTWNDGGGGGAYSSMDGNGFFYAMANSGYCRFDPPSGATPHEFGHVWEGSAAGFNGSNSSGAWWECTANWMQLQFLNSYPQAGGYIANGMYYPCHGRDYYDSFTIWEAALEDPRYGAAWVNEIWSNATPTQQVNEYILDRMVRLDASGSADKAGGMRDLWGDMAKKMVTWDFGRQQWLAQANNDENSSDQGVAWNFYQRCRTPLVAVPGNSGWYRPARAHLPMEYGFNFIPLQVTPGTTVSCNFSPLCDPVRQSDWRACLVAVNTAGNAAYSTLWNAGTNSITLSSDQTKLYLVVIATPKPMKIADPAWQAYLTDAGLQFPYAVSFTNASPKNVIYPVQSRTGMVQHANGGGWKSTSATVDATAYIGPNAQVLNTAQIRGNARVEDYAVVRNSAQVRDNAVVSGHAEVRDNAQVYGNAKVRDWARVFGHVEIYDNAKVIEHGNCGDGNATTHTKVYGNAIVKGTTYVYNTSTFNGCLIMDGDSANGNGTTPSSKGVHFGWGWGQDTDRFNSLPDNGYLYAQHTFEKDNAVFAMDQYGINHGFLVNGCRTGVDSGASSRGGRVLPLNGSNQYVELHNGVSDFKDGTYSVWFKISGGAADQRLWSFGDGASKVMYLTPNDSTTGGLRLVISNGAATHTLDGPAVALNTWKHAAVVFAGTTCTLYLDGAAVASNAAMTLFPDSLHAPLMENANYLGRGNAGSFFQGSLDDFRAYMKSLTAAEVSTLYSTAAPAPVTVTADTTAPTPNAATWLVAPVAVSDNTVTMSANLGTDASGWVEYYFTCVSGGGHDSGWVSFHKYTDVGLTPGASVSYTVKMRDRAGNTTAASAPAGATLTTATIGGASFAYGPVGIANGQITMTAAAATSASGKVEYKFDRTSPSASSSGWQSSPKYTQTGLTTGASYTYTVTIRDGRGNTSSPSAGVSAVARDDAAPTMVIPVAHWQMQPYATIDNKVSMTAQAATDASGVQYYFQCVSGGGPDSVWQDSATFLTPALPDGTYVYQYKVRDKSARNNESTFSTSYAAKITPTTGYHAYASVDAVLPLPDDYLASFPATVMKVNSDHYLVKNLATGSNLKVRPNTYALATDPALALKNVTVKGHMYTLAGERVSTYSTLAVTGNPTLFTISGRVTNASGTGIAGATVCFSDVTNASANAIVTATTDSNGNYSRGVTTGTWHVAVTSAAYNTSGDQSVTIGTSNVSGVNFTLVANASVTGTVTRRSDGTPVAGAPVYFSRSAGASASPAFTATTDANGNYSQAVQDGVWYVAAGGSGFYTSVDKTITVAGVAVGNINFSLKANTRNIPRTTDLLFSAVTDTLPGSGATGAWASYLPSGQSWSTMGSPTVEIFNGAKWVSNIYGDGDGFLQSTSSAPVAINGATIIVAARPVRNTTGTSWTSVVDLFYNRLVLGIRNNTGRIDVARNGNWSSSATAIPSGQATVLSLVVQPTGQYKVFANGVEVMNITTTSDMTSLVPNVPGGYANAFNVGRNNPDGWTTFNGLIGDVFVYKVALTDAERQQAEADLSAKFIASDYTITATAGSGGTVNPSGAVPVAPGGSQTFAVTPAAGQVIDTVTVNGVSQGSITSYTFSNVNSSQTISATFKAGSNTPPTISTIADQQVAANSSTGALAFTVGDAETPAASLTVSGSSSNQGLVPNGNIAFGGSGANRTVTVTPAAATIGSATITVTVSDGTATSNTSFLLNVTTPPGAPSISPIADQSVDEDTSTPAIPFTLSDSDTPVTSLTVSGVSSNPVLIPNANIVFGGSGANRTVVLTPGPNQSGSAVITLTVTDGTFPVNTAFQVTVNPVNDPPTISNVADLSVVQDSSTSPLSFTVGDLETSADSLVVTASSSNTALVPVSNIVLGGSGGSRTVVVTPSAGSSGSAVITLTVSDGAATAGDSFTLTVTPAVNATAISLNVGANGSIAPGDTAGAVPASRWNNLLGASNPVAAAGSLVDSTGASVPGMSASFQGGQNTFNAGFNPDTSLLSGFLSGSPMSATLSGIPYARYDVYVYYNGFFSNHSLTWRLSDVTGTPVVLDTRYSVRGSASSGSLFSSSGNSHVLSQYATLAAADAAAAAGTGGTYLKFSGLTAASIKIEELSNNGSNENGFTGIQVVNASAGSAPVVSDIQDQTVAENTPTAAIPFTVSDDETAADLLVITAASSNTTLVPNPNIVLGGSGTNRTVTVTPATDQSGSAIISLSVSDGTFTSVESFVLTVSQGVAVALTRHSGTSATSTYGDTLGFDVTVTGTPLPTGTVTLRNGGAGGTTIGSAALSSGTCTISPAADALAAGQHDNIVAVYSGDSNHPSRTSAALDTQTVNPKALTVTGTAVAPKVYDGTTVATLTGTPVLAGVLAGDSVTLGGTGVGAFADKNAGTGKPVTCAMTISGVDAENYSLNQPSLTGDITPRVVVFGGSRPYDGTNAVSAAGGSLTVANNVDGANLFLTGSAELDSRHAGSRAVVLQDVAPTRVRSVTRSTGANTATSFNVPLGTAAGAGNTLVAAITTRANTANRVTSIVQTGATWVKATGAEGVNTSSNNGSTTEVWYAANLAEGAATTVTINLAASLRAAVVVAEYSGLLAPNPLDRTAGTANNSGSNTSASTGTTAATTQSNEVWVGAIGLRDSTYTLSGITNDFATVASANSTSTTTGNNAKVYMLEKVVDTTGAAVTGGTVSTSSRWSGAIATFKASASSGLSLSGAAAGNYTLQGATGSVTIEPLPLTVAAVDASKTYDGTTTAAGVPTVSPALISGDTVTVLTQWFLDPDAGIGNKVIVPGITINDGNGGGNYAVTYQNYTAGTILPAPAGVTLGSLAQTYDGTPKVATATTSPEGLPVAFTYDGSSAAPVNAGSYAVVATVTDPNHQGSASGTLVVGKATATVTLGSLAQTYDGTPKVATVTTSPEGLPVAFTYDGSSAAPVNAGSYAVVATVTDPNHQGSASGTLVIVDQPYKSWQAEHFTPEQINAGLADEDADPDRDGRNNLFEFAFHGDPLSGADTPAFLTRVLDGGDEDTMPELRFTCAVRRGAVFSPGAANAQVSVAIDGVVYTIEATRLLAGPWDGVVTDEGASDTGPPGGGLPDLTGTDWEYRTFSAFNGAADNGFLRAFVAQP